MRIVVVGAGAVGAYLADRLASEGQDVVLIESDEHLVEELQGELDVLVLPGNGASRAVLEEARAGKADLVVAVTSNDGVNILACHNAKELGAPRTVARIEDAGLRPGMADMGVDIIIDPNQSVAEELVQLLPRSGHLRRRVLRRRSADPARRHRPGRLTDGRAAASRSCGPSTATGSGRQPCCATASSWLPAATPRSRSTTTSS